MINMLRTCTGPWIFQLFMSSIDLFLGKTTIADALVASNGIISQRLAGKVRFNTTYLLSINNHLKPNGDQRLISPHINTSETFIRIMRINEMIANLRCFDCEKKLSSSVPKEMLKKIWRIWILMLGWIRFNAELRMNYSAHKYSDC